MSKDYYVLIEKSVNDVKVIGIYNYSDAFSTKNKLLVDNPTVAYDIQGPFSLGCNKIRPILPKFNNKVLPFEITNFSPETEIEILIAEGVESPNWLPVDRLPSQTPQDRFVISLGEMNSGALRTTRVNGYDDRVNVLPRRRALGRVVTHSYLDRSVPKLGDYYHFMARDESGAIAVSSPIFVGSEIID